MIDTERVIIVLVLVCLLFGGTWLGVKIYRNSKIASPVRGASPTAITSEPKPKHWAPSYKELQPGELGLLDTGNGMTDIATTPNVLIGMWKAAQKSDLAAYHHYFKRNLAFQVTDGTTAKLLVGGTQINRVEILDGPYARHTGWIAMEWIRPEGSMPQKDRQH